MQPRRAQPALTIRSSRAIERLKLLTRDGRSQAQVVEEALDAMPIPEPREAPPGLSGEDAAQYLRLKQLISTIEPGSILSMKGFDALEYDDFGDLR